jgi:hypothetical protein
MRTRAMPTAKADVLSGAETVNDPLGNVIAQTSETVLRISSGMMTAWIEDGCGRISDAVALLQNLTDCRSPKDLVAAYFDYVIASLERSDRTVGAVLDYESSDLAETSRWLALPISLVQEQKLSLEEQRAA